VGKWKYSQKKRKEEKERYPIDLYILCVFFVALRNVKAFLLALGKLSLLQFVSDCKIIASKTIAMNFKLQAN